MARGRSQTKTSIPESEPELVIGRDDASERIGLQLDKGHDLLESQIANADEYDDVRDRYWNWRNYTTELLTRIFTTKKLADEFSYIGSFAIGNRPPPLHQKIQDLHGDVRRDVRRLTSIRERLELIPEASGQDGRNALKPDPVRHVDTITRRFHRVARELRARHAQRETLDIRDEYDVQDLLRSLLVIHFDDVREEEGSPSNAGSSPRLDFLLKNEQIVIEVKKTRQSLSAKQLGEELAIDIQRYRAHPDCRTLYCFVYDPDGYIRTADGLESDLSGVRDGMRVIVKIEPKH